MSRWHVSGGKSARMRRKHKTRSQINRSRLPDLDDVAKEERQVLGLTASEVADPPAAIDC
jgi:hypothetical protein